MVVYKKPIGKMTNALNKLIDIFLEDLPNMDLSCVMVTHSLGDESSKYLKEKLDEEYYGQEYLKEQIIKIIIAYKYKKKKKGVIERLKQFFERFFGIG